MTERIASYDGAAEITQHGRTVKAHLTYDVHQDVIQTGDTTVPGTMSWEGTIRPTERLDLGHATVALPEGGTGQIWIGSIEYIDTTSYGSTWVEIALGATASFHGSGPAPEGARQ